MESIKYFSSDNDEYDIEIDRIKKYKEDDYYITSFNIQWRFGAIDKDKQRAIEKCKKKIKKLIEQNKK